MSPEQRPPQPPAWFTPVLTFVAAGPLVGGLAFLVETVAIQLLLGHRLPRASEFPLALRVVAAAYVFGIVPTALTGYFHFYAHSWLRPAALRTIATCVLGAVLAGLLAVLGGQGGVILAYGLAGVVAAGVCIALTARLYPPPSSGLPRSR